VPPWLSVSAWRQSTVATAIFYPNRLICSLPSRRVPRLPQPLDLFLQFLRSGQKVRQPVRLRDTTFAGAVLNVFSIML
jgi:hypothetical protein